MLPPAATDDAHLHTMPVFVSYVRQQITGKLYRIYYTHRSISNKLPEHQYMQLRYGILLSIGRQYEPKPININYSLVGERGLMIY